MKFGVQVVERHACSTQ